MPALVMNFDLRHPAHLGARGRDVYRAALDMCRWADEHGFAHVADLAEIESNGFNLNIPLYVAPKYDGDQPTLAEALAALESAHARAKETRAALEAELAKWGLSA